MSGGFLDIRLSPRADRHVRTFSSEGQRDTSSNAVSRPSDDCNAIREFHLMWGLRVLVGASSLLVPIGVAFLLYQPAGCRAQ